MNIDDSTKEVPYWVVGGVKIPHWVGGVTGLIGLLVLGGGLMFTVALNRPFTKKSDYIWNNETTPLLKQAIAKSAGKDGIWSDEEKRKFLNYFGYSDNILQNGEQIYFRKSGSEAKIVLGNNLENNGGFLTGSSAKSGTLIGTLNAEELRKYK